MARKDNVPNYSELTTVTYVVLKVLGDSGKNDELNNKAAETLVLANDVLEAPYLNRSIGVKEDRDYDIDEEFFAKL